MTEPVRPLEALMNRIASNLRWIDQMQREIRQEGHAGWGNTLDDIAGTLLEIQHRFALLQAAAPPAPTAEPAIIAVVDGRCGCARCKASNENIYRMVGACYNCGAKPILMLFRAGDPSASQDCPVCGKWHGVQSQRLATPDEIPAAAPPERVSEGKRPVLRDPDGIVEPREEPRHE